MRCMHPGCERNDALPFGYARCAEHEAIVRHDNPSIAPAEPFVSGYEAALRWAHNIAASEADGDNPGRDGAVSAICQEIEAQLLNVCGIRL